MTTKQQPFMSMEKTLIKSGIDLRKETKVLKDI